MHFSPETVRVEVGAEAPDYRVYSLATGDTISLRAAYKGSVNVLNRYFGAKIDPKEPATIECINGDIVDPS